MYRVIKASRIDSRDSAASLKDKLQGLRKDMKLLSRCDTLTDVNAVADQFQVINVPKLVNDYMQKDHMTEEDAIDATFDQLNEYWNQTRNDVDNAQQTEANMDTLWPRLQEELSRKYEINVVDEDRLYVLPPADANQSDCIQFVDDVVAACGGRYSGTGRGGSWSVWDIISAEGVHIKAGWTSSTARWAPKYSWYVELKMH